MRLMSGMLILTLLLSLLHFHQLSDNKLSLRILNLLKLFLCIYISLIWLHLHSALPIIDLVCVGEPDVILVITDEFGKHLQYLNLSYILHERGDLKTLDLGILLKLTIDKKLIFIHTLMHAIVDYIDILHFV